MPIQIARQNTALEVNIHSIDFSKSQSHWVFVLLDANTRRALTQTYNRKIIEWIIVVNVVNLTNFVSLLTNQYASSTALLITQRIMCERNLNVVV